MTHPAATPPTAEQVVWLKIEDAPERLMPGSAPLLVRSSLGMLWVWTDAACYTRQTWIDMGGIHFAALAPAERAEAVPDDEPFGYVSQQGRSFFEDGTCAVACITRHQGDRRDTPVYLAAPTRAGALDAAGAVAWRENVQNGWAALGMVREWLESRFVGALPSQEAVLQLHGPEPVHEATAIVAALDRLIPQQQSRPVTLAELADALDCFWNASLGAQQAEMTQVSCMAEGMAAVANRLKECARAALAAGDGGE